MSRRHAIPSSNSRPSARKEFSNTAFLNGREAKQDRLHGRSKQVVEAVLANVITSDYTSTCTLEELGLQLCTTAASLRMALNVLVSLGLLSVANQAVYPTPQLLQQYQPSLSTDEAMKIVQQLTSAAD